MAPEQPAPFSPWVVTFLLCGPAVAGAVPRDEITRRELAHTWGRMGEKIPATWHAHGSWLRQAAAERNLRPMFGGKFFGESLATKGLR